MKYCFYVLFWCCNIGTIWSQTRFETSYLDASQKAIQQKKQCVVIFHDDQHKAASYMKEKVWSDASVTQIIDKSFVGAMVNSQDFDGKTLMRRWQLKKLPAVAVVNNDGTLVASADYGMEVSKLTSFLSFYADPINAKKSMNFEDPSFDTAVQQWKGFTGNTASTAITTSAKSEPVNTKPVEVVASPVKEVNAIEVIIPSTEKKEPENKAVAVEEKTVSTQTKAAEKPVVKTPVEEKVSTAKVVADAYFIQAGVFSTESNAKALVDKIQQIPGVKAAIETVTGEKTLYRVVVPGFATEADAAQMVQTLSAAGIKGFVKAR